MELSTELPEHHLCHILWVEASHQVNPDSRGGEIGNSLVGQWLRLKLPLQGAWVQSLVGELRSCKPKKKKKKGGEIIPPCGSRSSKITLQRGMNTGVGVILSRAIIVTILHRDGAQSSYTGSACTQRPMNFSLTLVNNLAPPSLFRTPFSASPAQKICPLAVPPVWGPVYALWPC